MANDTPQADALFTGYGDDVIEIARRIERGDPVTRAEIEALPDGANGRYGENITLLFHAFGGRTRRPNLSAIDALLAAGADPYAFDRPDRKKRRRFVYYLTEPQHPFQIDPVNEETLAERQAMLNEVIALFLRHGGDPNYRTGNYGSPLIADVALVDNAAGVRMMLEAGGDLWLEDEKLGSGVRLLASESERNADLLDDLLDSSSFSSLTRNQVEEALIGLSTYSQRGDERSRLNQRLAKRFLKRVPDYPDDRYTQRIFKGHYNDPPAAIPWDEIRSDAVR